MAGQSPRDVIAELLTEWAGDEADSYTRSEIMLMRLEKAGFDFGVVTKCATCAEDIDPFCIKHGWNGQGIAPFFREAVTEGYADRAELLSALDVPYRTQSDGTIITLVTEFRPKAQDV